MEKTGQDSGAFTMGTGKASPKEKSEDPLLNGESSAIEMRRSKTKSIVEAKRSKLYS